MSSISSCCRSILSCFGLSDSPVHNPPHNPPNSSIITIHYQGKSGSGTITYSSHELLASNLKNRKGMEVTAILIQDCWIKKGKNPGIYIPTDCKKDEFIDNNRYKWTVWTSPTRVYWVRDTYDYTYQVGVNYLISPNLAASIVEAAKTGPETIFERALENCDLEVAEELVKQYKSLKNGSSHHQVSFPKA